ncbi:hypothetical protein EXIGLDRAFT_745330 [Exidia glandulosa HHB12029]|uniref:RING-type domain-containing protein n=1 Tax=Exidia glandulosa HHB12029 TaxID=1314781 RepID=A0A166BGI0_EXIGL|nr:hypothetical protein EXIGLDRAFT_745330 [Exidia glandulosa HHB12029]
MSAALLSSDPPDIDFIPSSMDIDELGPAAGASLKRAASVNFEDLPEERRKRLRESEDSDDGATRDQDDEDEFEINVPIVLDGSKPAKDEEPTPGVDNHVVSDTHEEPGGTTSLEDELALELNCGCCTEVCYNPVLVSPCQHSFCGSCFTLWVQNGGTNCPACRTVSTSVTPARPLQRLIDILIKHAPTKARTEREKVQADEIYKAGSSIRLPSPKQPSPEPNVSQSGSYARPCPHCVAHNQYGWRCPVPIPDPVTNPENAVSLDEGVPVGHAYCGSCDHLHATAAPTSSKCDFCLASFCGIGVVGRCSAVGLASQHPHGFSDLSDLIQAPELYEVFSDNTYEVDLLVDYLRERAINPRTIYIEMVNFLSTSPRGFATLVSSGLFNDVHGAGAADPESTAPRRRVCRDCAGEIFISSLMLWWVMERKKGDVDASVTNRPDCKSGPRCENQSNLEHAKEFNHVMVLADASPTSAAAGTVQPEQVNPDAPQTATDVSAAGSSHSQAQPADAPEGEGVHPQTGVSGCGSVPEGVLQLDEGNSANKLVSHPESSDNAAPALPGTTHVLHVSI